MYAPMIRSGLLALACLAVGTSTAHAQTGTLPNGAQLIFNRLLLHEDNSVKLNPPQKLPDSLWHTFNMAHCVCSQAVKSGSIQPTDFHEATFSEELKSTSAGSPPLTQPVTFWVGTGCDQILTRMMTCHQVDPLAVAADGTISKQSIVFSQIAPVSAIQPELFIFDLMEPVIPQEGCTPQVLSATEYAVIDTDADGMDDFFLPISIDTDTLPPPLPTVFHVEGAENAIQISWDAPVGNVQDIAFYQALCSTTLGNPALPTHFAPKYQTPFQLCGTPVNITFAQFNNGASSRLDPFAVDAAIDAPSDAGVVIDDASMGADGGQLGQPMGLAQLDPNFICGEVDDATATSMRIDNLKNGVGYIVELLAIDKYGNPAGVFFTSTVTPQAVTDFWEDLHDRGSKVEGGFCLLAETYGDDNPLTNALRRFRDDTLADTALGRALTTAYYATLGKLGGLVHGSWPLRILSGILLSPLVAFALLWHVLTLPGLLALCALIVFGRRHRKKVLARAAAAATVAAIALAPGSAHAQAPYWEEPVGSTASETPVAETPEVTWHAGVRLGPYVPQIDAQLGVSPGPYQAMFGSKAAWTPMLDFDRVLWSGMGQLLVGVEVGYMGKSAHAWAVCADPTDFACSPQNPNRMRSAGDTTSFRLIPLAATVTYRATMLDDLYGIPIVPYAKAGLDYYVWWITAPSGDFADVMGNKADGASLGFQGSLGLAIRAERIDSDAARGMRESGIEHAGFYAEVQASKVDGFGSSTKLAVGDTTWFAGIDFEF